MKNEADCLAEDFLQISGIQHYVFCRRQWSLIHLENQWQENLLTIEGSIVHENCHDEGFTEKRRGLLISRGLLVYSKTLSFTGQCDVVEFHQNTTGAILYGREGYWNPVPVEYKRGRDKDDLSDIMQLCAQAICLEEMFCCDVPVGFLYYAATHRRESVEIDEGLRIKVRKICAEMHNCFEAGKTLAGNYSTKCNKCSLKDVCIPTLEKSASVKSYYDAFLGE